jgi:hypothetical protein
LTSRRAERIVIREEPPRTGDDEMTDVVRDTDAKATRGPRTDLRKIAGYAAIELESAMRDSSIGYKAVNRFVAGVQNQAQNQGPSDHDKSLFDPVTEFAMFRAIEHSAVTERPDAGSDWNEIAANIAAGLQDIMVRGEKAAIRQYKEFFLGLARSLSALERPLAEVGPQHPFRS